MAGRKPKHKSTVQVENYNHKDADNATRPEEVRRMPLDD